MSGGFADPSPARPENLAAARSPNGTGLTRSGPPRRHPQPVAVRVDEVALTTREAFFVDGDPELLGHGIDVPDVEMDQGVRPGVALVLREVEPDVATGDGDEQRETRLELVLPLLREPEPLIPPHGPRGVLDAENRHDLLVHGRTL